jgi:hypothetical protein
MNKSKDEETAIGVTQTMRLVPPDQLTKAEINQICAELHAKAEACLADAEEARVRLEEYGGWDKEDDDQERMFMDKFAEMAQGHMAHIRELREYLVK